MLELSGTSFRLLPEPWQRVLLLEQGDSCLVAYCPFSAFLHCSMVVEEIVSVLLGR